MSTALAIASVTAVVKKLLDDGLADPSVVTAVGGTIPVHTLPPDRIRTDGNESRQISLFLYNVAPNPGWRNVGQPSRGPNGERLTNAPLALDLYYLLTAYGKEQLDMEKALGYAMQVLHETPLLGRETIRAVAEGASSELAEQAEMVKLTPHPMTTEEISKLWASFQTGYRPSVMYHASVVLIESKRPARAALPVLTRGRGDPATGSDEGVRVESGLLPPFPTLLQAIPPGDQPSLRMGEELVLRGHHLEGQTVQVSFTHVRSSRTLTLAATAASATEITVRIPPDPAPGPVDPGSPQNPENWQSGLYSVAALVQRAGEARRTSNLLPVALAPRIEPTIDAATNRLSVKCSPKVWKAQDVRLIVGEREVSPEPIVAEKADTLTAPLAGLPAGEQWVRLRVDGIESILVDRSATPIKFDDTQKVAIP